MRLFRFIRPSAALLVGFVCALVLTSPGWAQRASSPTLSLTPVANPVTTAGGCLKFSVGCQTWLNPSWTFAAGDLRYQTSGGLNTSSTACFAVHTDLGSLSPFSGGGSGNDAPVPPQGAPAGGAWRTWCNNQLPLRVQGESQESIQIGSTNGGRRWSPPISYATDSSATGSRRR